MSDVGTTPRKPLTPTQRLKLFEAHKGICVLCSKEIKSGEKWVDEHIRPLALGGSNDLENRRPVHVACANIKTPQDLSQIAKAKRQKKSALGIKKETPPIKSRGFETYRKEPKIQKFNLPPRPMFEDIK